MKHLATTSALCLFAFALKSQTEGDQFFTPLQVHEIRLDFQQPGFLDSLKANYPLDAWLQCDITIDGQKYPTSAAKYKGNSSYNNPSKKKPFRIDLAEFAPDQAHDGLKKLVLNNGFKDPTFLREKLMLDFLNAHGIAAPRATFAKLFLNDRYWGLYSVVEDVNKTFLKDRFDNKKGNLFKGDPHGDLRWKGPDQSSYAGDYELKTNETANDWSDLIRLLSALNNTPAAALPDSLAANLNLESWFGYWAAHNLFVNLDSYVGSGHNYFLYKNTDTGLFEWITWDANEAFGNFNMGLTTAQIKALPFTHIPQPMDGRPMMKKLVDIPSMKQKLADRLCQLLQDFTLDKLSPRIDSLADLVRPAVQADTLKFFTSQQFEQNLSQDMGAIIGLKSFVTARRASLVSQLAAFGCNVSSAEILAEGPAVEVWPNPVESGELFIKTSGPAIERAELFDLFGRQVRIWPGGSVELRLAADGLASGLYLLKLEIAGRFWAEKLEVITN